MRQTAPSAGQQQEVQIQICIQLNIMEMDILLVPKSHAYFLYSEYSSVFKFITNIIYFIPLSILIMYYYLVSTVHTHT